MVAFNPEHEIFLVYVAALHRISDNEIHPFKIAQLAYLKMDEGFVQVRSKYADFVDVFSLKFVIELSKYTRINNYLIELVDNLQFRKSLIYNEGLLEQEMLTTYMKNNQASNNIRPFKSLARALIFFDKKSDRSLQFCIDYQGLYV